MGDPIPVAGGAGFRVARIEDRRVALLGSDGLEHWIVAGPANGRYAATRQPAPTAQPGRPTPAGAPVAAPSPNLTLQLQQQLRESKLDSLESEIAQVRKQYRTQASIYNRHEAFNEEYNRQHLERLRTRELELMRELNELQSGRSVSPTPTPFPTPDL